MKSAITKHSGSTAEETQVYFTEWRDLKEGVCHSQIMGRAFLTDRRAHAKAWKQRGYALLEMKADRKIEARSILGYYVKLLKKWSP